MRFKSFISLPPLLLTIMSVLLGASPQTAEEKLVPQTERDELRHGLSVESRTTEGTPLEPDDISKTDARSEPDGVPSNGIDTEASYDGDIVTPPKSPTASLASLQRRAGMTVELVASEPDIRDPVAFDWGPDGSLWVAEMRDYPNGISWNKQGDPVGEPGGCVRRLVDTDRDGRHDIAYEFLTNVPFVSGVKAWRNGVLVTAAPDLFYAEDTDGDGRADKREVLFRGFAEGNQQHRVNGMRWGVDQWLYLANGHSGGTIQSVNTGDSVPMRGRDLRIKPDDGQIELQSGASQQGRVSDDYGNWFGGDNSNPVWHYALDETYLGRNPHFAPPNAAHPISIAPGAAPVFPASRTVARFNDFDRANRFTSACSPELFRDDFGLQHEPRRFMYVCEPVHNLVAREVVTDNATTFTSRRDESEQNREFLAWADNWVRPSMVRTGPDGALWIADMYRLVIEHPEWIPKAWQDRLDLRGGTDKGRIYRVRFDHVPAHHDGIVPWYTLDRRTTDQLVASLDSSNGTLREMVQQLIFWRDDRSAIEPLHRLVDTATWPAARINALYLLDSFDALSDSMLVSLIKLDTGALSRHAIRLAEPRLAESSALRDTLIEAARRRAVTGAERRSRQQLAYSLGNCNDPRCGKTLARLLVDYQDDPYLTAAVMTSVNPDNVSDLSRALTERSAPPHVHSQILGFSVAMDRPEGIGAALESAAERLEPLDRFTMMRTVVEAIDRRGTTLDAFLTEGGRRAADGILSAAREVAHSPDVPARTRASAIALLGRQPDRFDDDRHTLLSCVSPLHPLRVQEAAVTALMRAVPESAPTTLLAKWPTLSPAIRQVLVDQLLSRDEAAVQLLELSKSGSVPPSQISARHRQQLLRSKNADVVDLAESVFMKSTSTRKEVVERFADVPSLPSDAERGKQIFVKHCASCHRFGDEGHHVGPDLAALSNRSPSTLLTSILDPNRAVEDKYVEYSVATTGGQQFSGLLTSENAASIRLTMADGKQQDVLRNEIEEIRSTSKSLMPEGLEQDIKPQAMADLLHYLRSVVTPPKRFPGNHPQIAPVRDDGSIRLFAIHARIYGPTLVLEPQYRNLGSWKSSSDRATWTLDVPKGGTYEVNLDYACDEATAKNRFDIQAGDQSLQGTVPSTGHWGNYVWSQVGEITLPKGRVDITLRATSPLRGELGDFRTIILEPKP